jgi:hypothetical protein
MRREVGTVIPHNEFISAGTLFKVLVTAGLLHSIHSFGSCEALSFPLRLAA